VKSSIIGFVIMHTSGTTVKLFQTKPSTSFTNLSDLIKLGGQHALQRDPYLFNVKLYQKHPTYIMRVTWKTVVTAFIFHIYLQALLYLAFIFTIADKCIQTDRRTSLIFHEESLKSSIHHISHRSEVLIYNPCSINAV